MAPAVAHVREHTHTQAQMNGKTICLNGSSVKIMQQCNKASEKEEAFEKVSLYYIKNIVFTANRPCTLDTQHVLHCNMFFLDMSLFQMQFRTSQETQEKSARHV